MLKDKLSTRIRLNTNRCLGVLKVLKEIMEFAILISWYQISLAGISQFSKANGRYPNNKPSWITTKKGFCTDWARQTSVENLGLVLAQKKKLLYWGDILKHFSLCGSFRPASYSNKIMFWIKSYLLVDFT